jgi:hypothetical protein
LKNATEYSSAIFVLKYLSAIWQPGFVCRIDNKSGWVEGWAFGNGKPPRMSPPKRIKRNQGPFGIKRFSIERTLVSPIGQRRS